MKEFPVVAVEVDSDEDYGFTVAFDRTYDLSEGFPISEDAGIKAVDDAWGWGYDPQDLEEMEEVGKLVVDDSGKYVRTYVTK